MSRYTPHWQGIIRGFQTSGNGPWQVSIEMPKGRNIYDGNPDHGPTIRFGISQVVHVLTDEGLAEAKAQALEEFAEIWATGEWSDWFLAENVTCDVSAVQATDKALRERAQQIRDGK